MKRIMLKSKIHKAKVTDVNKDYEGSIAICPLLLCKADILEHEQVHVWNITNGNRFITYAIEGYKNEICINGAAAHKAEIGDEIIVCAFAEYDLQDYRIANKPTIINLGGTNNE